MSSSSRARVSVFFDGYTALQILRAAQMAGTKLPRSRLRTPPTQAPTQGEVLAAIDKVEASFPGLQLARPAHILLAELAHCWPSDLCASHICSTTFSEGSFLRVCQGVYVPSPELCFIRESTRIKNQASLLELGFELCGSYRTRRSCAFPAYQVQPLTTVHKLHSYAKLNASASGTKKATRAAQWIADDSASPRETQLAIVLGLPCSQGGGGLGVPHMNYKVEATRKAQLISGRRFFLCDLCWPEAKLDVEYQSREMHQGETARISDSKRTKALKAMEWDVEEVTNVDFDSPTSMRVIVDTLRKDLGKDPRIRVKGYDERTEKLRIQLGLPLDSWRARNE